MNYSLVFCLQARQGQTTVIIAHWLSSAQTADVTVGIVDGAVVEWEHTQSWWRKRRQIIHLQPHRYFYYYCYYYLYNHSMQDDISQTESPLNPTLFVRAENMTIHRYICYSAILQSWILLCSIVTFFICENLRWSLKESLVHASAITLHDLKWYLSTTAEALSDIRAKHWPPGGKPFCTELSMLPGTETLPKSTHLQSRPHLSCNSVPL